MAKHGRKYTVGKGLDEYIKGLDKVTDVTRAAIGMAIYDGAKVVADAIHNEIEALPPLRRKKGGVAVAGVTPLQRKGLLEGLGISTIKDEDGVRNVKIGFDGYNEAKLKSGGKQPNVLVARWLINGTSVARKNDFVGRAIRKSKAKAENAMKLRIDKTIHNVYKTKEI